MSNNFLGPNIVPQSLIDLVIGDIAIGQAGHHGCPPITTLMATTTPKSRYLLLRPIMLNFLSSLLEYFLILDKFLMARLQIFGKREFLWFHGIVERGGITRNSRRRRTTLDKRWIRVCLLLLLFGGGLFFLFNWLTNLRLIIIIIGFSI